MVIYLILFSIILIIICVGVILFNLMIESTESPPSLFMYKTNDGRLFSNKEEAELHAFKEEHKELIDKLNEEGWDGHEISKVINNYLLGK